MAPSHKGDRPPHQPSRTATYARLELIAEGIDILTISRRVGHSNATTTLNVYGHLVADSDDRAAQAVAAMFARVSGGNSVVTER